MEGKQADKPALGASLRRLLPLFSPDWIIPLLDLIRYLYRWLMPPQPSGMYEILDYRSILEIMDGAGAKAISRRRQQVRFLQDDIIAFQDHVWGEGEIFAGYRVSPGVVADRYQESDRWNVLISLRETRNKGDVADFFIERTIQDGFIKAEEWWQVEVWYRTRRMQVKIIFPRERHCQRAVVQTRGGNRTMALGSDHFRILPDGRQLLTWQIDHPEQAEIYTLRWVW